VADVFYEVDEQLRSARLLSVLKRSWPYLAIAAVIALLIAFAVWGWSAYQAGRAGASSERYADAMEVLARGDTAGAAPKFSALAKDGTPAYRALALMQEAGLRLKADDPQAAAALLDRAAAQVHDPVTVDGARLRAAFLLMDSAPLAVTRSRLEPLTAAGRPFRMLAREGLAVAELAGGQLAQAKGDFELLSISSDVSDATRVRANAALALIQSHSAANLGAIAKAAAGLKPTPPPPTSSLTPQQMAALRAQIQAQAQGQGQAQGQAGGAVPPPSGAPQ